MSRGAKPPHLVGSLGASSFEAASFEASSFEAASFEASSFEAASFEVASFEASSFEAASFVAFSFLRGPLEPKGRGREGSETQIEINAVENSCPMAKSPSAL